MRRVARALESTSREFSDRHAVTPICTRPTATGAGGPVEHHDPADGMPLQVVSFGVEEVEEALDTLIDRAEARAAARRGKA